MVLTVEMVVVEVVHCGDRGASRGGGVDGGNVDGGNVVVVALMVMVMAVSETTCLHLTAY